MICDGELYRILDRVGGGTLLQAVRNSGQNPGPWHVELRIIVAFIVLWPCWVLLGLAEMPHIPGFIHRWHAWTYSWPERGPRQMLPGIDRHAATRWVNWVDTYDEAQARGNP